MDRPADTAQNGRKIIEEGGCRLLAVSSQEDMKIISSPQRQRIFKLLQTAGKPLHGKEIADYVGIKAPSAHFHLHKLEEIGAVRISHTQSINGITATYYEPAVDGMLAGEDFMMPSDDEQTGEKLLFAANIFNEAKSSFIKALGKKLRDSACSPDSGALTALVNEILYLSADDIKPFYEEMDALLKKYTDNSPDKQPYALFMSVSGMEKI